MEISSYETMISFQNNYFMFSKRLYCVKSGTAMGTKFALTFANIVTGYYEIMSIKEPQKSMRLTSTTSF